jgi:hypothetical protein
MEYVGHICPKGLEESIFWMIAPLYGLMWTILISIFVAISVRGLIMRKLYFASI